MLPNNIKQFSQRPAFASLEMHMIARATPYNIHAISPLNGSHIALVIAGTVDLSYDYINGTLSRNAYVEVSGATDSVNNGTFKVKGLYTSASANSSYVTIENAHAVAQAAASGTVTLKADSLLGNDIVDPIKSIQLGNPYYTANKDRNVRLSVYDKQGYFLAKQGNDNLAIQFIVLQGSITVDVETSIDMATWRPTLTPIANVVIDTDGELMFVPQDDYPRGTYFRIHVKAVTSAEYAILTLGT